MKPSPERLEALLHQAGQASPERLPAPPTEMEAAVLRAWRLNRSSPTSEDEVSRLFRRATFASLGICAVCAVWSLLIADLPTATSPEPVGSLVAYTLNLSIAP